VKHRVAIAFQTVAGPDFAVLIVETVETDPLPGSERWLAQLEKEARESLNSRDVLILSWQPLIEEPECSTVECLPAPAPVKDHCSRCLWWTTRHCPDGRPAPGSQDACKLFKPKL
jgi:hypothetical protein